jgi:large subunit ribosomal protein L54
MVHVYYLPFHLFCILLIIVDQYFKHFISISAKGMAYQPVEKKELEVETDPEKLVNYCCGANYFKEGEDPKIKPDEEYPDWLWELHTERQPIPLGELDENDPYYWRRVRKMHFRRNTQLMKKKR